jgi:hypothetical protein
MTRPLALVSSAAVLLLSSLSLWSGTAWAKPKVALTQIEGDASGDVHDAVAEAIDGKELSLISNKDVNRAVDRLGDLADLTERDFKKLATELEADAIVLGKLDKVGSSRTLKFRLFVHKKMAKGFTVSFKNAKSEKFRTMLHDKLVDKIGVVGDGGEDDKSLRKRGGEDDEDPLAKKGKKGGKKAKAEDEEDTRSAKKAKAADEEEARPAKKARGEDEDASSKKAKAEDEEDTRSAKKAKRSDEDAASGDDDRTARGDDEEEAPRRAKKKVAAAEDGEDVEGGVSARVEPSRGANHFMVRVDAGVSVLQRTFKFSTRSFEGAPKGAALKPVPGARVEGEIYPLASSRGMLAGIGFGGAYDRTLSLNIGSSNETGVKVPVKQSSYSVGLRYRMAFGSSPTSSTLTFGVGYGKRLFSPDSAPLTMDLARADLRRDTPNTHYTVIDPGVMFRFPVTRMVALSAGGRGLIIRNTGSIGSVTSYGLAKVYGMEAIAALDVVLGQRFALRFAGEFVQVGFTFQGAGELSRILDGDRASEDVGGFSDRSIGGSATLAVMY